MLGGQRSVVIRLVFMPGLSCFENYSWFFFAFGGITCCGSASLKLRVCDAAYPWSQSPSPNSQRLRSTKSHWRHNCEPPSHVNFLQQYDIFRSNLTNSGSLWLFFFFDNIRYKISQVFLNIATICGRSPNICKVALSLLWVH